MLGQRPGAESLPESLAEQLMVATAATELLPGHRVGLRGGESASGVAGVLRLTALSALAGTALTLVIAPALFA